MKIDGKHSFEDTIEDASVEKQQFGNHLSLLGGIDVDFLCRASEAEIRQRVQHMLYCCHSDGGYFMGTGNAVTDFIPAENYLAMVDEGKNIKFVE